MRLKKDPQGRKRNPSYIKAKEKRLEARAPQRKAWLSQFVADCQVCSKKHTPPACVAPSHDEIALNSIGEDR